MYAPKWVCDDQSPKNLYDQILPGLYQGGTPDEDWAGDEFVMRFADQSMDRFDAVVTLFSWAAACEWGVEELRYGFPDADPCHADMSRVVRAARWAHTRWRDGDTVLVRCQAGLNRSGLVTALILMLDGWEPAAAISRIRAQRAPVALRNDRFVEWLMHDATHALTPPTPTPHAA